MVLVIKAGKVISAVKLVREVLLRVSHLVSVGCTEPVQKNLSMLFTSLKIKLISPRVRNQESFCSEFSLTEQNW